MLKGLTTPTAPRKGVVHWGRVPEGRGPSFYFENALKTAEKQAKDANRRFASIFQ